MRGTQYWLVIFLPYLCSSSPSTRFAESSYSYISPENEKLQNIVEVNLNKIGERSFLEEELAQNKESSLPHNSSTSATNTKATTPNDFKVFLPNKLDGKDTSITSEFIPQVKEVENGSIRKNWVSKKDDISPNEATRVPLQNKLKKTVHRISPQEKKFAIAVEDDTITRKVSNNLVPDKQKMNPSKTLKPMKPLKNSTDIRINSTLQGFKNVQAPKFYQMPKADKYFTLMNTREPEINFKKQIQIQNQMSIDHQSNLFGREKSDFIDTKCRKDKLPNEEEKHYATIDEFGQVKTEMKNVSASYDSQNNNDEKSHLETDYSAKSKTGDKAGRHEDAFDQANFEKSESIETTKEFQNNSFDVKSSKIKSTPVHKDEVTKSKTADNEERQEEMFDGADFEEPEDVENQTVSNSEQFDDIYPNKSFTKNKFQHGYAESDISNMNEGRLSQMYIRHPLIPRSFKNGLMKKITQLDKHKNVGSEKGEVQDVVDKQEEMSEEVEPEATEAAETVMQVDDASFDYEINENRQAHFEKDKGGDNETVTEKELFLSQLKQNASEGARRAGAQNNTIKTVVDNAANNNVHDQQEFNNVPQINVLKIPSGHEILTAFIGVQFHPQPNPTDSEVKLEQILTKGKSESLLSTTSHNRKELKQQDNVKIPMFLLPSNIPQQQDISQLSGLSSDGFPSNFPEISRPARHFFHKSETYEPFPIVEKNNMKQVRLQGEVCRKGKQKVQCRDPSKTPPRNNFTYANQQQESFRRRHLKSPARRNFVANQFRQEKNQKKSNRSIAASLKILQPFQDKPTQQYEKTSLPFRSIHRIQFRKPYPAINKIEKPQIIPYRGFPKSAPNTIRKARHSPESYIDEYFDRPARSLAKNHMGYQKLSSNQAKRIFDRHLKQHKITPIERQLNFGSNQGNPYHGENSNFLQKHLKSAFKDYLEKNSLHKKAKTNLETLDNLELSKRKHFNLKGRMVQRPKLNFMQENHVSRYENNDAEDLSSKIKKDMEDTAKTSFFGFEDDLDESESMESSEENKDSQFLKNSHFVSFNTKRIQPNQNTRVQKYALSYSNKQPYVIRRKSKIQTDPIHILRRPLNKLFPETPAVKNNPMKLRRFPKLQKGIQRIQRAGNENLNKTSTGKYIHIKNGINHHMPERKKAKKVGRNDNLSHMTVNRYQKTKKLKRHPQLATGHPEEQLGKNENISNYPAVKYFPRKSHRRRNLQRKHQSLPQNKRKNVRKVKIINLQPQLHVGDSTEQFPEKEKLKDDRYSKSIGLARFERPVMQQSKNKSLEINKSNENDPIYRVEILEINKGTKNGQDKNSTIQDASE
ncbi:uncharacterized protein LOC136037147 [Artemia franciscana]|uniref:uncharacterized protein LOC136037147 n=1 Tax=Artemia franciscana TaxID=6661 RepID=UPI0032DA04A8